MMSTYIDKVLNNNSETMRNMHFNRLVESVIKLIYLHVYTTEK